MQTIKLKLVGQSPLLMHSDKFANPLDEATKQHKVLTSKRKKLDEDHADIAKSEWMGSLYHDQEIGVFVPGQNIKSALVGAAKIQRLGAAFKRAVLVLDDKCKLEYSSGIHAFVTREGSRKLGQLKAAPKAIGSN